MPAKGFFGRQDSLHPLRFPVWPVALCRAGQPALILFESRL